MIFRGLFVVGYTLIMCSMIIFLAIIVDGSVFLQAIFIRWEYRVIKTPIDIEECEHKRPCVGRSENGVYFATMHDTYRLRVWILMESSERVIGCSVLSLRRSKVEPVAQSGEDSSVFRCSRK